MSPRRIMPHHCTGLGAALAHLHTAGQDFDMYLGNALSVTGWRPLFESCRTDANGVQPGLEKLIEDELAFLEANWPHQLPAGVIHADLFPDNVFFFPGKDDVSGLIDFYFACNDLLAYDIATCLNAWCFEKDGSYNLTKGTALLEGYQSVRPLEGAEIEALPLLARGSALRFMLTRLYDWLTVSNGALVNKRDPMEYVRRLRFHRQISSASEYGVGLK